MDKPTYEQCLETYPDLEKVVTKNMWEYVSGCDKHTNFAMSATWRRNAKKNLKKLYPKFKTLTHSFHKFGKEKALIGVGAGPSLNNNINHLLEVFRFNAQFTLANQPFIIATCNHQFKPLLHKGIFPHFVFLSDGGDHMYDQLCTDIPKLGQASILVATLYANHKILRDWVAQGRHVCFTIPSSDEYQQLFKDVIGEDPKLFSAASGGNVLNTMFSVGLKILHARYFMALGNDLSYPESSDVDKRRELFYADGDYSVNIKKGVDEAKDKFVWCGFTMRDNPFEQNKKIIDFKPMNTSRQMFIYKTWAELHVSTWGATAEDQFVYFNCSEGGIAGVLAREYEVDLLEDPNNWYLLDEIVPKRWRTRSFMQAVNQFLEARLICRENDASAIISPGRTAFA